MSARHTPESLAAQVAQVYCAQRALGCEVSRSGGLSVARNARTPLIYDANFAWDVDAALASDARAFEAALAAAFSGVGHRQVVCQATDPPVVEARLAAMDFEAEAILQLVLTGALRSRASGSGGARLAPAESEDDWAALVGLQHANFAERTSKAGQPPMERVVAEQMVSSWRMKSTMRFWLARVEGEPCGFLGSWVGLGGLGMVESLYVDPARRHRGIATALIQRGVAATRDEGAEAVLIGADVADTPRRMYVDLGFEPVCVVREWLRTDGAGGRTDGAS